MVATTCPYCGVGCGVMAAVDGAIAGDPDHPANFGRLCAKGSALADVLVDDDRLLYPHIAGRRVGWDQALDAVAGRFRAVIDRHGPDAVAFYVSGQLLTEDYYVANKLMKGFIGSANIDTNSRLCMASAVAGHQRAFGADVVPGCYDDLEAADLVVLVGSNLAWCHPVLHQRLLAAKAIRPGMKIVVIDPRRTATAETADLHLDIAPGGDIALFEGLLAALDRQGCIDRDFVANHSEGVEEALAAAHRRDVAATGLDGDVLREFYRLFAATEKVVTVFSQGVNQSRFGTDKVNAIINCHLFTGRIARPGMGPFSVTGQPNAMGGREVGGLANQLACHMALDNPAHRALVREFWGAPTMARRPGLKAVELFEAIGDGRVKAVWIMATNPVDSLPDADRVRAALRRCETVVVSDVTARTDTANLAHILLPAAAWGEKDGTVTNSERRISRQRSFRKPLGEARGDWRIICDVAARLGWRDGFAYDGPAAIFREYAALSAYQNHGERAFDIGGLAAITDADYAAMTPKQWPLPAGGGGARPFSDRRFFTPSRRARFITPARQQADVPGDFPYILNTGRIRDQWHMMTRTGQSPRLSQHLAEPFAEINPEDALKHGIGHASLVEVESRYGKMVVRALMTTRQQLGSIFVPMHWNDQFASNGRVDALVAPIVDPVSGQPDFKASMVAVKPFAADWYGFAVLRDRPAALPGGYWALARTEGGWRLEIAGHGAFDQTAATLRCLMAGDQELGYRDERSGQERFALFTGDRLTGIGYFGRAPVAVSRQWAAALLKPAAIAPDDRRRLLAGRAGADRPDPGATICACHGVGINDIRRAIAVHRCADVEAIGVVTKAGSHCGSCRSELKRIIDHAGLRQAV